MSERGGHSDKLGNRYEALWLAKQLLRVAQGRLKSVLSEPIGDDEKGVDAWLTDLDECRIACQCKAGLTGVDQWPMHTLGSRGVLDYLRFQLERDGASQYRFVSGVLAASLDELGLRARHSPGDPNAWLTEQVNTSRFCKQAFQSFCKRLQLDPDSPDDVATAFSLLRRSWAVPFHDNPETRADLEAEIHQLFEGHPSAALSHLRQIAADNPRRPMHQDDVLSEMESAGFGTRLRPGDDRTGPAVERAWHEFEESIQPWLLGGGLLARSGAKETLDLLSSGTRVVVVHAPAGYGKSCLLFEVCQSLRADGVPVLPLRLDLQTLRPNLETFGQEVGLPGAPHFTLGNLAVERKGVLVLDQLDALQWTGKNAAGEMAAFKTLCRETLQYSNLSILVACRSFDLKHDPMIRKWSEGQRTAQVSLGELRESVSRDFVEQKGQDWDRLAARQKLLLRSPQALRLWLEIATPHFATMSDLMREYWKLKWRDLAQQGLESEARDLVRILLDDMENNGRLSVPYRKAAGHLKALNALQSLHVLTDRGKQVTFTHQSFPDFLHAERTLDRMESDGRTFLELAPNKRDQTLYFRHQLRHLLDLLRDQGGDVFERTLTDILTSTKVRFHLRHLTLAWLGALSDPTDVEQAIVDAAYAESSLADHISQLTYSGSASWMRRLFQRGDVLRDLRSDDESTVSGAAWLMWQVREQCGDEIASAVAHGDLGDESWQRVAAYVLPFQPEKDTDALFATRLELARRCVPGKSHIWMKLAQASPKRCAALLAAYADGLLSHISGEYPTPIGTSELYRGIPFALAHAGALAADQVRTELVPRLKALCAVDQAGQGSATTAAIRNTVKAITFVVAGAAIQGADTWAEDHVQELAPDAWPLYGSMLMHAPPESSDAILAWLLKDKTRLRSLDRGYTDHPLSKACKIIGRCAKSASDEAYESLERAILDHRDASELNSIRRRHSTEKKRDLSVPNKIGLARYFLLRALPANRMSTRARSELEMLHRKFEGSHWIAYPRGHHRGGWVRSPISDRADRLSDSSWIKIVTSERTTGERWDDSPEGVVIATGAEEFARDLGRVAQLQPDRFCALATRFPPSRVRYIDAVLSGVSWKRPPDGISEQQRSSWQPATPEAIEKLLAFVEKHWHEAYSRPLARLLGEYTDIDHAPETLERVRALASDPDPRPGEVGFDSTYDGDDARAMQLATAAITCTRGCVAETLASLTRNRPEVAEALRATVDALCNDPHPAVRVASLDIALAFTAQSAASAIDMFLDIVGDSEEQVLITRASNTMIGWSYSRDPDRIGQLLRRMVESEDPAVARAGAVHASAIHIVLGEERDLLDHCLAGSVELRTGAARAASDLFGSDDHTSAAVPLLRTLFADDSDQVRQQAKACFRGQSWLDVEEAAAFARETGHTNALQEDPENLVLAFHGLEGSLLQHADLIFAICRAYSGDLAKETRSIQSRGSAGPHWLGPVLFRLYEQANQERETATVEAALDAIDALLEARVGIRGDLASTFDA